MSALTPEAARAAAAWIVANYAPYTITAVGLRDEADRMEKAAKTPGQVLVEVRGLSWAGVLTDSRRNWEEAAAAVIAHVVGPDRVVVDQADVKQAVDACALNGYTTTAIRLREALS